MENIDIRLEQLSSQREGLCQELRKLNKEIRDLMQLKYGKEMEDTQQEMYELSTALQQRAKDIFSSTLDYNKLHADEIYKQQCEKIRERKNRLMELNDMLYPCNDTCDCCHPR